MGATAVGGEFGYQHNGSGSPNGAGEGIASSGYLTTGISGDIDNFNGGSAGTNLDDPDSLDGINFGIVSSAAGFDPNGGLGKVPLIQGSVTFVLDNVLGLAETDISNVSFQYGTGFNEANIPGMPGIIPPVSVAEPSELTLLTLGLGLLGLGRYFRKRPRAV